MSDVEARLYQVDGALHLASKSRALLADEPGVGKTAQAIYALKVAQCRNVLILCPSIARLHWARQFETFYGPGFSCSVVTSARKSMPTGNGIICSYDLAIRSSVSTWIISTPWDCVICDESHYLNGLTSKRTALVYTKLANVPRLWALSGTPAKNHAGELWGLLHAFGVYRGKYWDFVYHFCTVEETVYGTKILGTKASRLLELRALLDTIMLRRTKEDVLSQLPSLTYDVVPVEASPVDLRVWFSKIQLGFQSEEQLMDELAKEVRATEQILNLLHAQWDNAATALGALQVSTGASRRFTGLQKVPKIVELVRMELLEGHYQKIVLFAWHRDVIECLRMSLREFHPVTLYGGQLLTKKDTNINAFQTKPHVRVMIANIQAAGVAIDLTAATEVVFVEASYVPSDNAQAVMRVHRFPQKQPVRCRFFAKDGSIDYTVMQILRRKTKDLTKIFATADGHTIDEGHPDPFAE